MDELEDSKIDQVAAELMKLGDKMAYMYDKHLLSRFKFSERLKLKCAKCQTTMMNHTGSVIEHPFFMNNLEFIEWEAAKKNV